MNQKKKLGRKVISYVLVLVMAFGTMTGIVPGMGLKAYVAEAATLTADSTTWDADSTITDDVTINGNVTVNANMTLTIPDGKTLIVNGNINADGKTLTVAGKGSLVVTGTNGGNGSNGTTVYDGTDLMVEMAATASQEILLLPVPMLP